MQFLFLFKTSDVLDISDTHPNIEIVIPTAAHKNNHLL
jgi:hypothetical protein